MKSKFAWTAVAFLAAAAAWGQGASRPQNCEIPLIELMPGKEAAPEVIKPGTKFIWAAEKKPGMTVENAAWTRFGPFQAAGGQRYLFDAAGGWGADSNPAGPKLTPGDASVKFRNLAGKNPVYFCVEGTRPPAAGGRRWQWKEPLPPRYLDVTLYLEGGGKENLTDSEMPGMNKVNAPVKLTVDESVSDFKPVLLGNGFFWEDVKEEGDTKAWLRISGQFSEDGLRITTLDISYDSTTSTARTLTKETEEVEYHVSAYNIPLVDDEGDGVLAYKASSYDKPPAKDFYFSGIFYSFSRKYTTPDKTRTTTRGSFDDSKLIYTVSLTFKAEKGSAAASAGQ